MRTVRFLSLLLVALFLLTLPVFGLAFPGAWQANDDGYTFICGDPKAPKAVCQKVQIQGSVFYYDPATGNYYDMYGQDITYTVNSGKSIVIIPSPEGPILLVETGSVAFSNGKSVLGYMKTDGKVYFPTPEELMSAMGRIDFLIFIADPPMSTDTEDQEPQEPQGSPEPV